MLAVKHTVNFVNTSKFKLFIIYLSLSTELNVQLDPYIHIIKKFIVGTKHNLHNLIISIVKSILHHS